MQLIDMYVNYVTAHKSEKILTQILNNFILPPYI